MNKEVVDIWMDEKGSMLLTESYFQAETNESKTCPDVAFNPIASSNHWWGGGLLYVWFKSTEHFHYTQLSPSLCQLSGLIEMNEADLF